MDAHKLRGSVPDDLRCLRKAPAGPLVTIWRWEVGNRY